VALVPRFVAEMCVRDFARRSRQSRVARASCFPEASKLCPVRWPRWFESRPTNTCPWAHERPGSDVQCTAGDIRIARKQVLDVKYRKMSLIHTESRKRVIRKAVDKIEDAKSREFNKAQQGSTSRPQLIETEAIENRALSREA
jgi:hypothetical protein